FASQSEHLFYNRGVPTGCATKRKGDACEAHVLAALVERDLNVLVPWGDNTRYDLAVDIDGRFLRIQCKTGRLIPSGCVRFRSYGVGRDTSRVTYYSPDEIDYFGVWCLDTGCVYIVPIEDVGQRSAPHLRVEPPRPGSTGGRQT